MKNNKRICGVALAFCMALGTIANTAPVSKAVASNIEITQTRATKSSVSFSWEWDGKVNILLNGKSLKKNYSKKSYTLKKKGMAAGQSFSITVLPVAAEEGTSYTVRTLPAGIKTQKMTDGDTVGLANFNWIPNNKMCDGYQIRLDNAKGKEMSLVSVTDPSMASYSNLMLNNNTFYKARIRGYISLPGKSGYGTWSSYRYAAKVGNAKFIKGAKDHSIKVSFDKVKKASKYVISVGTKADGSDAVATKTLKPKKTSATLKKMGGNEFALSTYYYVFITPYIKVGKKQKKSDIATTGNPVVFYAFD